MFASIIIVVAVLLGVPMGSGGAQGAERGVCGQMPWHTARTRSGDTSVVSTIGAASALADLILQKSLNIGVTSGPPERMLGMVTTAYAGRDGSLIALDRLVNVYNARGDFEQMWRFPPVLR